MLTLIGLSGPFRRGMLLHVHVPRQTQKRDAFRSVHAQIELSTTRFH